MQQKKKTKEQKQYEEQQHPTINIWYRYMMHKYIQIVRIVSGMRFIWSLQCCMEYIPCVVFRDFDGGGGGDWSPSFSSDGDECFFDE